MSTAAAASPATATACAPFPSVDPESFSFDSCSWPSGGVASSAAVAALRAKFARGLRQHDGRIGVSARRLLRYGHNDVQRQGGKRAGWQAAALLSWAHHCGRAWLLPQMLSLLQWWPLQAVLRYTPQLPLLHSLVACWPGLGRQQGAPRLQLPLLHSFCNSAQPNLAALRWLLAERLQFAPRDIRNGDEPHPLSSMVRRWECECWHRIPAFLRRAVR